MVGYEENVYYPHNTTDPDHNYRLNTRELYYAGLDASTSLSRFTHRRQKPFPNSSTAFSRNDFLIHIGPGSGRSAPVRLSGPSWLKNRSSVTAWSTISWPKVLTDTLEPSQERDFRAARPSGLLNELPPAPDSASDHEVF
jgi:hypothetical protein